MNTQPTDAQLSSDAEMTPRIVVGFDGSRGGRPTVEWAAREALAVRATVRVVACLAVPSDIDYSGVGRRQRHELTSAMSALRRTYPQISVEEVSTHLDPRDVLLDEARGALMLVVGGSTAGSARRRLLGSVPRTAARRSSCPVIIVRGRSRSGVHQIVVGIDSSKAAVSALDWGIDQANHHAADLTIVHAWERPGRPESSLREQDLQRADAQCILDQAVRHAEKHTGHRVVGRLINGEPTDVLTTASADADLLIVGSRGPSGFKTMLFGSVALFLVEHAACPVAVIHPTPHAPWSREDSTVRSAGSCGCVGHNM